MDLLREGIALLRDNHIHVASENPDICKQGGRRDDEHRGGVVSASVREHRVLHEMREGEHHSRPESQRVGPVLDPRASPKLHESRNRTRRQQCNARIPGAVRQTVVDISEIPQVVGNNPPDRQVAPD